MNKPNPFKCYIDGVYYKTSKGYMNDLEKHMIDGSWDKAMENNTKENRKYVFNYRAMNGKFEPSETPNKLHKAETIPIYRSTIIHNMMEKFKLSKTIEVNE